MPFPAPTLDRATRENLQAQNSWATTEAVNRAQLAGTMKEYELFLELPTHMQVLLAATPFEDKFRACKLRHNRRLLQVARYKDKTWRSMIFLGFYTGPRCSEFPTLEIPMYQPHRGGILGWPQPKKGMATRDACFRGEDWLWNENTDGSPTWYLRHVRPLVAKDDGKSGTMYLNSGGEPWTVHGVRNIIREGISLALQGDGRGPHSLRRGCATWRYHCGWELDEIALLLDDDVEVVKESYIDWAWIRRAGRRNERSPSRTPPVRRITGRSDALRNRGAEMFSPLKASTATPQVS